MTEAQPGARVYVRAFEARLNWKQGRRSTYPIFRSSGYVSYAPTIEGLVVRCSANQLDVALREPAGTLTSDILRERLSQGHGRGPRRRVRLRVTWKRNRHRRERTDAVLTVTVDFRSPPSPRADGE